MKNPNKTRKSIGEEFILKNVLDYATNADKTKQKEDDEELFVSGINCNAKTTFREFVELKEMYGKTGGVQCYHGYQSFPENEVTPEECHNLGVEFAQKMWGDTAQVVVCTHLDKQSHLHNHFVVNSVALDGHKLRDNEKNFYRMKAISDEICKEHNLSVVEQDKSEQLSAEKAKKENTKIPKNPKNDETETADNQIRSRIKADCDRIINDAISPSEFVSRLRREGYLVKTEVKHMAVFPPFGKVDKNGRKRFIRLKSLGEDYTKEKISERIYNNAHSDGVKRQNTENKLFQKRTMSAFGGYRNYGISPKSTNTVVTGNKKTRTHIREDCDRLIESSVTVADFVKKLESEGYIVDTAHRHLEISPPFGSVDKDGRECRMLDENGNPKFIRLKSLGFDYAEESIAERIYERLNADKIAEENRRKGIYFTDTPVEWDKHGLVNPFPRRKARMSESSPVNGVCKVVSVQATVFIMHFQFEKIQYRMGLSGQLYAFQRDIRKLERFFKDFRGANMVELMRKADNIDFKEESRTLQAFSDYSFYLLENGITKVSELDSNIQSLQKQIMNLNIERLKLRKELRDSDNEDEDKRLQDEIIKINEEMAEKRKIINMFRRVAEVNTGLKNLKAYQNEMDFQAKRKDTTEQIKRADNDEKTEKQTSKGIEL